MRTRIMAVAVGLALTAGALGAGPAAAEDKVTYRLKPHVNALKQGACPAGDKQWFENNDKDGAQIAWTYTNGSRPCVTVLYEAVTTSRQCDFYFYVPRGFATALVRFDFTTADGTFVDGPGTYGLDEEDLEGWQHIGTGARVTSIFFTDANGQRYKSKMLGWGMDENHWLKQVCPQVGRRSRG
ncbi:hypothetical protein ABZ297_05235 [Nonomuraea sp. NPDC005983]|uniref:hypothetical protein n=1 Tax=Nonomuraea sp. NPDC005983 TaxID=3155595 RepID=UPI0033A1E124